MIAAMKPAKLLERARAGSFHNIKFDDLVHLAETLGFVLRSGEGSHQNYRHPSHAEAILNLQEGKGGDAKPYQIRELLDQIDEFGLMLGKRND